jgi:hypothetical protein
VHFRNGGRFLGNSAVRSCLCGHSVVLLSLAGSLFSNNTGKVC